MTAEFECGVEENSNGVMTGQRAFNTTETSVLCGVEYVFSEKFGLNLRFTNSLLPIREHASGVTTFFNRGQYNTGINFSLRYYLTTKDQ